jgi:hypothetical protein
MKKNLMNSIITSRAACLAELISNPKSFFNCPDLHGGSGSSEGRDGSWEQAAWSLEGAAGSSRDTKAETAAEKS